MENIVNNDCIRILLDQHLLDFTKDEIITIPEWFDPEIKGLHSGGPDTKNYMLTDMFSRSFNKSYNVYYCYPNLYGAEGIMNINNSIDEIYNNTELFNNILICIINFEDLEQIIKFQNVFKNYFDKIEIGYHSHVLKVIDAEKILDINGIYYRNVIADSDSRYFSITNIENILPKNTAGYNIIPTDLYYKYRPNTILNFIRDNNSFNSFTIFPSTEIESQNHDYLETLKYNMIAWIYYIIDNYSLIKFKVIGMEYLDNIVCVYYVYFFLLSSFRLLVPDTIYVYLDISDNMNTVSYFIKKDIQLERAIEDYFTKDDILSKKKYLKYKQKYLKLKIAMGNKKIE
jgi:hypothetical protein